MFLLKRLDGMYVQYELTDIRRGEVHDLEVQYEYYIVYSVYTTF
jgi:hypothetical protein